MFTATEARCLLRIKRAIHGSFHEHSAKGFAQVIFSCTQPQSVRGRGVGPILQMGKLRLRQAGSSATLMQPRSTKQNWLSTLGRSNTSVLFSTTRLHGLFGTWKQQRLRDEETSVFPAPKTSLIPVSPSPDPQGGTFHLPTFLIRKQELEGMDDFPRILLGQDVEADLGPVCPKLLAFPLPLPSWRRPLALGHPSTHTQLAHSVYTALGQGCARNLEECRHAGLPEPGS